MKYGLKINEKWYHHRQENMIENDENSRCRGISTSNQITSLCSPNPISPVLNPHHPHEKKIQMYLFIVTILSRSKKSPGFRNTPT